MPSSSPEPAPRFLPAAASIVACALPASGAVHWQRTAPSPPARCVPCNAGLFGAGCFGGRYLFLGGQVRRAGAALLMLASTGNGSASVAGYLTPSSEWPPTCSAAAKLRGGELFVDGAGEKAPACMFHAKLGLCSDPASRLFGLSLAVNTHCWAFARLIARSAGPVAA